MGLVYFSENDNRRYKAALKILFEINYERVYKAVYSITLDSQIARHITKEAFYSVFIEMNNLDEGRKFSQVVYSTAIDKSRELMGPKISLLRRE